jgi:regulation of enolase protein 1 (concanavalin A-like superfamily)
MYRNPRLAFLPLAAFLLLPIAFAEEEKAQTIKGWGSVVNPDGDCKVTRDKDKVTIAVPGTYHDLTFTDDVQKQNAPRILGELKGDFTVQVKVRAFPLPQANTSSSGRVSFVSAGLLIWLDDKNFVRLDRAAEGASPSPFIWVERFQDGKPATQKLHRADDKDTWLRIVAKDGTLTFAYSEDGDNWTDVHTEEMKLPEKVKAGVLAINTTTKEFAPALEGFKVEKK